MNKSHSFFKYDGNLHYSYIVKRKYLHYYGARYCNLGGYGLTYNTHSILSTMLTKEYIKLGKIWVGYE